MEDGVIRGWAWNEHNSSKPARVAIVIDGDRYALITPQDFRGDLAESGIAHGCFAFSWTIPERFHDGTSHEIRFQHLDAEMEVPGSPVAFKFDRSKGNDQAFDEDVFVNADFGIWPNGVRGAVPGRQAEIGPGVHVSFDADTKNAQFALTEPRYAGYRRAPYFGLRISADDEVRGWVHHRLNPASARLLRKGLMMSMEVGLGEAPELQAQRMVEIWLTRETRAGFEKVRRLVNARAFRLATQVNYRLSVIAEDLPYLEARTLFVGVSFEKARAFRVYPSQRIRVATEPTRGLEGFEDEVLEGAFAACERMALGNGQHDLYLRLLDRVTVRLTPSARTAALAEPAVDRRLEHLHEPFTQIILPVFNGDAVVLQCLQAVQRNTHGPYQVVIVNDGSQPHTSGLLAEFTAADPRFVMADRTQNRGYTKSVNEGVKMTSADWVVVLNSDTVVSDGWLGRLHAAALAYPNVGMVGPLSNAASYQSVPSLRDPDGSWSKNPFIDARHVEQVQQALERVSERAYPTLPLLNGFCTLISRRVFDACGLLDEDAFPLGYGEETDLCLRAGEAGFVLVVADDCFVYHHKSMSFGDQSRKILSRAGNLELTNKHLGTVISKRELLMQDNPVLARLRQRLESLRLELR